MKSVNFTCKFKIQAYQTMNHSISIILFHEKLQMDLRRLDDATALLSMDVYAKNSLDSSAPRSPAAVWVSVRSPWATIFGLLSRKWITEANGPMKFDRHLARDVGLGSSFRACSKNVQMSGGRWSLS